MNANGLALVRQASRCRVRLVGLWISQNLHFFANYALRIAVVFHLARTGAEGRGSAFHLTAAIFMAPSIFLVPFYGALSNTLPKRGSLIASSGFCAFFAMILAAADHGWLLGLGFLALGSSLYVPTRFAILPAAAHDTDWPLQRIMSAFETGSVVSMVAGMLAGGLLFEWTWAIAATPPVLAAVAAAHILSFLTAVPAQFPSDIRRLENAREALVGFGRDVARIWINGRTRGTLISLAALRAVVTAAAGAFVAAAFDATDGDAGAAFRQLWLVAIASILGAAAGSLAAGLFPTPDAALRVSPLGVLGMAIASAWAAWMSPPPLALCAAVGACGGLVNVPLLASYQEHLPADARGNGMTILSCAGFLSMTMVSSAFAAIAWMGWVDAHGQLWIVAGLTAIGAAVALGRRRSGFPA